MKWSILLSIIFLSTSCGLKLSLNRGSEKNIISGVVSPLVGSISYNRSSLFLSTANATSCADAVVAKIFIINHDGSIDESTPLASQVVGPDARYSFNAETLGLLANEKVQYLIKAQGCNDDSYKRPVTDFNDQQDLNAKTTIISEVVNANSLISNTLNEVSRKEVENLINSMSGSSISTAYASLQSDAVPSNKFTQIFGTTPDVLQFAKPEAKFNIPTSLNELSATTFSVQAFHIDPSYSFAYSWKLDGVVKSTMSSYSYTPTANASGTHTVDLYAGRDNGSGSIDFTKPYFVKSVEIMVNNNIVATPPNIVLNASNPSPVNTTTVSVDLATGVSLANCTTFSHLAITDTATAPDNSQFTIDCATNGTQTETVTFSNGDGTKTLYLWAIDHEGHISNPKTVTVILDTLPPVAFLTFSPIIVKGNSSQTITLSGSDAGVGLASLDLYFSATGSNPYTLISNLNTAATSYTWTTPSIDTVAGKLKLVATDLTGLTTTTFSNSITIDSIAPTVPTIARTSPASSNSTMVTISATCTVDYDKILYSETSSTPLLTSTAWEDCTTTKTFAVSSAQGAKTIYAFTKDAAGNISTSSNITMTLDTVAPSAPVATRSSNNINSSTNVTFTITDCLDRPYILVSESILAPSPSDSSWQTCSTTASGITHTLIGPVVQGIHNLYVFAKDSVGNISLPTSLSMVYDTTNPTVSLNTTLAALYKGGDVVTLIFSASDTNGLSAFKLEYAADGSTFSTLVANLSTSATSYNWTVPSGNTITGKLKLTAIDNAITANSSSVTSNTFTIDSTAPTAPTISRISSQYSPSNIVTISATCTADYDQIIYKETSSTPSLSDINWEACSANKNFTTSASDGVKPIYAFTRDAAGNISPSSNISMTLDTTAPTLSLTSFSAGSASKGGVAKNITWSASDLNLTTTPISISYSTNGSTYTPIVTSVTNSGTTSWTLPSINSSTVTLKITATDLAGNIQTVTSGNFSIDITAPVLTSISINNGATSSGSVFVSIKIGATDNISGVSAVRFSDTSSSGDCQAVYVNNNWQTWTNSTTPISYSMSPVDGRKKICVWAKDAVGNISVTSPTIGTVGVDYSTIDYYVGNPPVVASLTVVNGSGSANAGTTIYSSGDPVNISWSLTDSEGLSNSPVSLYVSLNGADWITLETNYGSLSGNPTSSTGTYTYTAPASGVFRIKLVAIDMNGNTSVPAVSGVQNSPNWSVYAGSTETGVGGKGTGFTMYKAAFGVSGNQFAVNPINGDIYAISNAKGVFKMDAMTGNTSLFILDGTNNITDGMSITNNLRAPSATMAISFDKKGRLYIVNPDGVGSSSQIGKVRIFQIDFANNTIKNYVGGGDLPGTGTTLPTNPNDAFVLYGSGYDFDDNGNLYFASPCDYSTFVSGVASLRYRILKLTQNSDGTPGVFSIIAGDCSSTAPTSGADALAVDLGLFLYTNLRQMAVSADGSLIYLADQKSVGASTNKLVYDSNLGHYRYYTTTIGIKGLVFDRMNNQLYGGNESISKITIPADPTQAETVTTLITSTGTGDCNIDGTDALSACINAYGSNGRAPLEMANDGTLLFTDSNFRIRYLDANSKLRTLMGTRPFYGEGLHRSLARGRFSGIYYKTSSLNTTDYPKGLYFIDSIANTLNYIHPTTGIISIVAGNQQQLSTIPANGAVVDRTTNLGGLGGSNFRGLTFDSNGLPLFMVLNEPVRLDSGKVLKRFTVDSSTLTHWFLKPSGSTIASSRFVQYWSNLNLITFGSSYLFSMGVNNQGALGAFQGGVAMMNFTDSKLYFLMKGVTSVWNQAASPDSNISTDVNASPLAGACYNQTCYVQKDPSETNLYFSETNKIRKLTNPTSPGSVTLSSPANMDLGRAVRNFAFSPDNNRIYYDSNGYLYCKWIGTGTAPVNCQNTTTLSPPYGYRTLSALPSQFTFSEDGKLFISNDYEIYLYEYTP